MKKERVDKLIVDQGLARSRTQAQALIMAGQVCIGDQLVHKASEVFLPSIKFRLKDGAAAKYVSRGGQKMEGALIEAARCASEQGVKFTVEGTRALDVGISTGGFTDCLLQHGAVSVIGVDVGHNQLDWKIRNDSRVKAYEGINARDINTDVIPELAAAEREVAKGKGLDLCVIDVSFISLTLVLPQSVRFLAPGAFVLALIKPQFEVEKNQVGKGGLVKDPLLHDQVREKIRKFSETQVGLKTLGMFSSSIEGTDGNKEFFIFAQK